MSASTLETEALTLRASRPATPEPVIIRYKSWPRKALSFVIFPGMIVGAMSTYFALIGRGVWPPLAILGISIVAVALLTVLEIVHPHTKYWVPHGHDVRADAIHMFTSELLPYHLYQFLFNGLLVAASDQLVAAAGFELWPHHWPLMLQLPLLMIMMEFSQYWLHRATHTLPFLWRIHAVHHSSPKLYWLASIRFHPSENWLMAMVMVTPVVLLGANIETMMAFSMFINVFGTTQHANISMTPTRLFNYIFAMPELHRWHHAKDIRCNYGGYLAIWDVLFGSRYMPLEREQTPDNIGIAGLTDRFPKNWAGHMLAPFRNQAQFYDGPQPGGSQSSERSSNQGVATTGS